MLLAKHNSLVLYKMQELPARSDLDYKILNNELMILKIQCFDNE